MVSLSRLFSNKIFSKMRTQPFNDVRSLFTRKKKKEKSSQEPYEIVRPGHEDFDDCLDLMWNTYFKEEPISKTLRICKEQALDEYLYNILCKGHSFIAKKINNGCVIGGCVNYVGCSWEAEELLGLACLITDPKTRTLLKLWSFLDTSPDLWVEFCMPKVFEVGQPFVHQLERCRGIAEKLARCSIESTTDCGYPLIRFNATGTVAANLAEKLCMKVVHEIPYRNYIGQDDKPVVEPPLPDYSVKVYVIRPFELKE